MTDSQNDTRELTKQIKAIMSQRNWDLNNATAAYQILQAESKCTKALVQYITQRDLEQTTKARIDEIKELVVAQGTYPEDRSYGHGSFHHVPTKEAYDRLSELERQLKKEGE